MTTVWKGEIPFVRMLVPLILGISVAFYHIPSAAAFRMYEWILAGLFVTLVLFIFLYKFLELYKRRWAGGVLVFMLISLSGYLLTVLKSQKLNKDHFSNTQQDYLFAVVCSEPKLSGDILRFETEVRQVIEQNTFTRASGNLLLAVKLKDVREDIFKYGDGLLIPSYFTGVEPPYNPAEFDFKSFLANKAIYHQTFIRQDQIKILKQGLGNTFMAYAISLRQGLVDRFSTFIRNKDAAAVASTLILGYRADLSKEVLSAYSSTGTMHVLSVSGMHVGIIFMVVAFLLKPLDKYKQLRVVKALFMVMLIVAYTAITGFSAAACRAALMLSFVIVGKAISRSQNSYNLVSISAVLLLIYNPYFLRDVGFQLSYLAVLGLIYLYPKIYRLFYIKNWFGDQLWSYSALSLSAQMATFPIGLYYFHQFPVYFLISNLFIVLPVTFIMYAGLAFILIPGDIAAEYIGWLLDKSITFTNTTLFKIESFPGAALTGFWIKPWEFLLIYLLIFLLLFAFAHQTKRLLFFAMLTFFVLVLNRSMEQIKSRKTDQVIFYSLRKDSAIGFFHERKAYVLTSLLPGDKTFLFSIKPSLEESRVVHEQILPIGTAVETSHIFSNGNFIQFKNWKMLIWDKTLKDPGTRQLPAVNAVLIRDNPPLNVRRILNAIKFEVLLIDDSNNDYNIRKWQEEAGKLNVNHFVLKKKKAFTVQL